MVAATSDPRQIPRTARQVAKDIKVKQKRHTRKDKNKNDINQKNLTPEEKNLFYLAKVKELQSFFECGVWEFNTVHDAEPSRTLTSRIGSPRAKARLVVRGYNDVDALNGQLETASPTTSRLGRSCCYPSPPASSGVDGLLMFRLLSYKGYRDSGSYGFDYRPMLCHS